MQRVARQASAVFSIYLREGFVYPASWIIWILTDATTMFLMPMVMAAAAGSGQVGGYTASNIYLYYLVFLTVQAFVTSHLMWEIAMEIKEGLFTAHLMRPISYFQAIFVRNLAYRLMRTLMSTPIILLYMLIFGGRLAGATPNFGWEFFVALVLGHCVSYCFVMAFAMVSLFVQEATSIFELYYVPFLFLSGYLFPVAFLPPWATALAKALPFYYTTGVPTEIAVGRLSGAAAFQAMGYQVLWIVGSYVLFRVLWASGRRQYTGVGM